MSRGPWLALVAALTSVALAATFVIHPKREAPRSLKPEATPFDWVAHFTLVAGDGVRGFRDGPAPQARFADPYGVALDAQGALYVTDAGDNNRIRRIGRDGVVATFAGSAEGFADGAGTQARFHTPSGLATDRAGNLYVADTGNHAIRKVSPQGVVSTLAGNGVAGFRDGPGAQAQFNGPIGVAVDTAGRVLVADTYNDRIRVIQPDGQVATLAGGGAPGYLDGAGAAARFDTPTALVVDADGSVLVADTRNHAIRRIAPHGEVTTLLRAVEDRQALRAPVSLALTADGMLYVGEQSRGRVLQVARHGAWRVLAGATQGARLSRAAGLALDATGALYVADATSYRVHRLAPGTAAQAQAATAMGPSSANPLPDTGGRWPLHPQMEWHEVVGTLGEVRGNYEGENRDHLHGGLDIRGDVGQEVLAIADAKVSSPSATWGLGELGEGLALDELGYIHMRVGRTPTGKVLDPERFQLVPDDAGKPFRMRVRRGTRFSSGDVLGTINGMAHVHLTLGANGYERNAIELGFKDYADAQPPRVDSIRLLDATEQPLTQKRLGRIVVPRDPRGVHIVVDAWDQVDRNLPRRRLGLHALGYQVLRGDGSALPGFEAPRMNIEFNRMPADDDAVKVAYGPDSGITVHGSRITRFQYVVTNTVRDGRWQNGAWQVHDLPAGDYLLRITARDYLGNVAQTGRDLLLTLE